MVQLENWLRYPGSNLIWMEGVDSDSYKSDLSLDAMRLCTISMDAGIPCISFFSKSYYSFTSARDTSHGEAALISLTYSIIVQLANLLPVELEAADKLISLLDGSINSVPVALQLIEELLVHAPPALMWVLDGIQLMENDITRPYLRQVVEIVRNRGNKWVSKACFTTNGNSCVLMKAVHFLAVIALQKKGSEGTGIIRFYV